VQLRLDEHHPAAGLAVVRIVEASHRTREPRCGPGVPRNWPMQERQRAVEDLGDDVVRRVTVALQHLR
jgi:hypothetical protein